MPNEYEEKLEKELLMFKENEHIHDLPRIFHYWSNKYLKPIILEHGFTSEIDFFASNILAAHEKCGAENPHFISIGSGNCDQEIHIAKKLQHAGLKNFFFECTDINDTMLQRGAELAKKENIDSHMKFINCDSNMWHAEKKYTCIIANQSLHHIVNLESLFFEIKNALLEDGSFIIADMIGRNGHKRWPEALEAVHMFWQQLPHNYKYNNILKRHEEEYENWDCSNEGFEGIRAQDILPLLVENFYFQLFIPFGNIIDIFTDRAFGHNFDAKNKHDTDFIDKVHHFDEQSIQEGRIKPTHLRAVLKKNYVDKPIYSRGLTPEFCIRKYPANPLALFAEDHFYKEVGFSKETAFFDKGVYHDFWIAQSAKIKIKSGKAGVIIINGYYPGTITKKLELDVEILGKKTKRVKISKNSFEIKLKAEKNSDVYLHLHPHFLFKADESADTRELSFVLADIRGE